MAVGRVSTHRVAVLRIVTTQSSVTAAAAEYGLSRGHLHRLLRRYRGGGLDALEPRSPFAWHLEREGLSVPTTSTIRRILLAAALVVPAPLGLG